MDESPSVIVARTLLPLGSSGGGVGVVFFFGLFPLSWDVSPYLPLTPLFFPFDFPLTNQDFPISHD